MCVIRLFQNPGDFISTLVLIITLVVLVFYTIATFGLKKAAVKQTELNLRPFIIIRTLTDSAGQSEMVYKNIGHSPALDVIIQPFDAGTFMLDFEKQSLIEVGETKALNPTARGKDNLSDGLIQAVADPGFTPSALAARNSDLKLLLTVCYKNIEQIEYITLVHVDKRGVIIQKTERTESYIGLKVCGF